MLRHEWQTVTVELAVALHHSRGVGPDNRNNVLRDRSLPAQGWKSSSSSCLKMSGPRIQWHTVKLDIGPFFDVSELHMAELLGVVVWEPVLVPPMVEQVVASEHGVELLSQRAKLLR